MVVPEVDWPPFPDPQGNVSALPDGRVAMTLEYWRAVARYVVDVEAGIAKLEAMKEAADGVSK